MAPDELFTRDEVLGGLPARRAASTLFLIESRAAYLADQSHHATDFLVSEDAARRRDLVFLEAFSGGREPPVKPTIQDLEHFAPAWARLVPPQPALRAAVAHMVGRKYRFTREAVPRLRAALGLDEPAVAQAFRRQHGEDVASLYASRVRTIDRLRLAWSRVSARVDALPAFWLTFLLTIAFSFSQAFLAVPTGVASMGALPGVTLVIAIGFVNVLTMACMAEACARSGDFRYGKVFLGRLVTGYLGGEASVVFSAITALRTSLVMLAGSIGIAFTLAASTGLRAEVWIAVVAVGELYYVSRKSQMLTITTMLSLLAANLALTVTVTGLALARLDTAKLLHVPVPAGGSTGFDAVVLKLAFGVIVMLYIGHVYVIQCAKIVLPRDPSARSLIQGSVAGTLVLVGVFSVWILAVNGVVPAERLAREIGTALPSLAERIGPVVSVLGSVLVVVLLGMSCLRTSTVVFNLVQERLPSRVSTTLTMPRRRGDLVFEARGGAGGLYLGMRYLGLSDELAHLRIDVQRNGTLERTDAVVAKTWDAVELLSRIRDLPIRTGMLTLEIVDAEPNLLRLRVTTTMGIQVVGDWSPAERHPVDVADLPSPVRDLALLLMRRGEATLSEAANEHGGDVDATRTALGTLLTEGFAERVDASADPRYRIRLGARRDRRVPPELWRALGQPSDPPAVGDASRPSAMMISAWRIVLSDIGRFVLSSTPILLVGLLGETLLLTERASFAGVLGFGGVVANSMTAGIFPVLLLLASRRKGDCIPGTVYSLVGHPVVAAGVYLLFTANLFLHGLVIYHDVWSRGCALVLGLVTLAVTARTIAGGAFRRRAVVELREDVRDAGRSTLTVIANGQPLAADITVSRPQREETHHATTVTLGDLSKVTGVAVKLPRGASRDLKVWVHRVTPDGASEGLAATVNLVCLGERRRFDLGLSSGQAVAAVNGEESLVVIALRDASER